MDHRLGVLAFGDSITNGGGELQWGVALHSWALWTARGLGLPYSGFAVDGATVGDVVRDQIPRFADTTAQPGARYDVGCCTSASTTCGRRAGIRRPTSSISARRSRAWSGAATAGSSARSRATSAARAPAPRSSSPTARSSGRPVKHDALVCDLRDFGARNRVMVDAVHPTAFGQVAIAERALDLLAADGMTVRVRPQELIAFETTRWRRLRGDATYVYRQLKQAGRNALRR